MTRRDTKTPATMPGTTEPVPVSPYVVGKRAARQAGEPSRERQRPGVSADVQAGALRSRSRSRWA